MKSLFANKVDKVKEKAKHEQKLLLADIDYELMNLFDAMQNSDENEKTKAKERLKALHKELAWRDFYEK